MAAVDVTIRIQVAEHERDYVSSGSSRKETPVSAAIRMVRAGFLGEGEYVVDAKEVR